MLAQLWDYCQSVIQATDKYKRHLQLVFLYIFLSSTAFPQFPRNYFGFESESQIRTVWHGQSMQGESSCPPSPCNLVFTAPADGLPVASRCSTFRPSITASSSHYSSTLSAGSADHGPATLITAVSTSDSVVLMNSVTDDQKTDEQEVTISIGSASPSTRKQCPCHQRSSLSTSTSRMACASMS